MNAPAASSPALLAFPAVKPAAATAATLLLALAGAAFLVLYGEPSLAVAATVAPSIPTVPQRPGEEPMNVLTALRQLISGLHKALAERRRLAGLAELRDLDARTLADIGVSRSEIASIEAEWRGGTEVTRQRIVRVAGHA